MSKEDAFGIMIFFAAFVLFAIWFKESVGVKDLEWKMHWICNHYSETGEDVKQCDELFPRFRK